MDETLGVLGSGRVQGQEHVLRESQREQCSGLCPLQVDNAYWLWTFQGRLLQKNNKDRFCQLLWRPRPPTLLSQDQIKVWGPRGQGSADALLALTETSFLSVFGWSRLRNGNGTSGAPFEEM